MNNQCRLRVLIKDVRYWSGSSSSVSVYFLSIPEFLVNVYGKVVFLHLHLFYLIKPHTQGQKSIPFTSFIYIVTDRSTHRLASCPRAPSCPPPIHRAISIIEYTLQTGPIFFL